MQEKTQKSGRTTMRLEEYSSIQEFNRTIETRPINHVFEMKNRQSSDTGGKSFTNTTNYEEAEKLYKFGWKVASKKLTEKLPVQTTQGNAKTSRMEYNVVGGQACVPRYLQGVPTNMINRRSVEKKQKIIVINRDICFSGWHDADDIEKEGLKALQIVQALENKGFRVKLNVYFASHQGNEVVAYRVPIKKPDEKLSVLKCAFPLAHPSMLRRITFKWMETHPTMKNKGYVGGYGKPSQDHMKEMVSDDEYFLPSTIGDPMKFIEKMNLK